MMQGVWCRGCKVAWTAAVAEPAASVGAAVTAQMSPVRCPQCHCYRRVALTGDEEIFRRVWPQIRWLAVH